MFYVVFRLLPWLPRTLAALTRPIREMLNEYHVIPKVLCLDKLTEAKVQPST